ncbi:MAG: LA_2272 family surface repeat-containing protein [Rhodothermaceae bacterium]
MNLLSKKVLIVCLVMIFQITAFAQEDETNTQVSFIYPLGTSGSGSLSQMNSFSFNVIWGMNGGLNGFELGGAGNYNVGNVSGLQIAGVTNINTKECTGVIFAGAANITLGKTSALLLSPINITANEFNGLQFGIINFAKKLNGVQIGLINISNSSEEGLPIGFINIVKKGYYAIELSGNETIYGNLTYKMGVKRFYSLFKFGYSEYNDKSIYNVGFGFGSLISIAEKHNIAIELSGNNLVYDNKWEGLNLLNMLDISYQYSLTDKVKIKAGPTFNVYISDRKPDGKFGTIDIPYTIYERTNNDNILTAWIGFNIGAVIEL